jgi:hypothetical protein
MNDAQTLGVSTTRTFQRRLPIARTLIPGALAVLALWGLADGADAAPAASIKAAIKRDLLTVSGTAGADVVALRLQADDPTTVEIDVGADGSPDYQFNRQRFSTIVVNGAGGADRLTIDQSNGAFTDTEATTLDGGAGNDTLVGGFGSEVLRGGAGNDFVDGNQGVDTVDGGDGTDVFQWDPGDASDTVNGGGDADRLVFNGSGANEILDVAAVEGHVRLSRNVALVALDLDDVETVEVRAGGGTDTITVNNLAGTDLTELTTDLAAFGGASSDGLADDVIVNGTSGDDAIAVTDEGSHVVVEGLTATVRTMGADPALDELTVHGLDGNDTITPTPGAGALIQLTLAP